MTLAEFITETRAKIADLETQLAIQRGILAGIEGVTSSIIKTISTKIRSKPVKPGKIGLRLYGEKDETSSPKQKRKSPIVSKELVSRITEVLRSRPAGMTIQEIADAIREDKKVISNFMNRTDKGLFLHPAHGIYALRQKSSQLSAFSSQPEISADS